MKKFAVVLLVAAACATVATIPRTAVAHHSQAMYTGPEGAISITGVVKKFEYTNPHGIIYLEVTGSDGQKKLWICEMQSVRSLKMLGWLPSTVKFGDTVTIIGRPARDGAPALYSEVVKLPDGRSLRS